MTCVDNTMCKYIFVCPTSTLASSCRDANTVALVNANVFTLCSLFVCHLAVEHFEKEAMAWDSLQMRCKMSTVKEEPRGRPKRRPDRKAKRPQGEKKTNGRVLKAAKLSHNQAGPCLAVNKIKAKDERIAVSRSSCMRV